MKTLFTLAAVAVALLSSAAQAEQFTGRVVRVLDGDTIEVMKSGEPVRVRLLNIDAPEKKQPFGKAAAGQLSYLIAGAPVTVDSEKNDRYGRVLGLVYGSISGTPINAEMVRTGYAWTYTQYNSDPALPAVQKEAQNAKCGLWAEAGAVAPWEYRHNKKAGK